MRGGGRIYTGAHGLFAGKGWRGAEEHGPYEDTDTFQGRGRKGRPMAAPTGGRWALSEGRPQEPDHVGAAIGRVSAPYTTDLKITM